jgi:hypothetical protein
VLAAHEYVRWNLGLSDAGGGRERPDARWGAVWAMWRAGPFEGVFVSDGEVNGFAVLGWVRIVFLKWVARNLSGGTKFKFWKAALCCVYRMVRLRIH